MRWFFVAAVCLLAGGARAEEDEDVDYLGLVALMLRDGHPDRAASILESVDPDEAGLDLPRFYTLRGLARLQAERPGR